MEGFVRPSHQYHLPRQTNQEQKIAQSAVDDAMDGAMDDADTTITFELYGIRRYITPARRAELLNDVLDRIDSASAEDFSSYGPRPPRRNRNKRAQTSQAPRATQAQPARPMKPGGMAQFVSNVILPRTQGHGGQSLQELWRNKYPREAARLGRDMKGWVPVVRAKGADGEKMGGHQVQRKDRGMFGSWSGGGGDRGHRKRKRNGKGNNNKKVPESGDEYVPSEFEK